MTSAAHSPLTKNARQQRIVELLESKPVRSQTELADLLASAGVSVTQATLSRDLLDLDLTKLTYGTFSIAACDLEGGQWGVATQSKFLGVGSVVPWAEPQVGAIATQAWANPRYGPDGLALLREGLSADEVVERLTSADDGRDHRQLGVVDGKGGSASFSGAGSVRVGRNQPRDDGLERGDPSGTRARHHRRRHAGDDAEQRRRRVG